MVASACYVEIAIASKAEWNPITLEELIDNRYPGRFTGKYRKMIEGTVPNNKTCIDINEKLSDKTNVIHWRDKPFWSLLHTSITGEQYINKYEYLISRNWPGMEYHLSKVTNSEFMSQNTDRYWEEINYDEMLDMEELIELGIIFEIFSGYTAWAREARERNLLQPMYHNSIITRKLFAKAICNTPHLYIRWPLLAKYYNKLIWTAPPTRTNIPWYDIKYNELEDEIIIEEKLARKRTVNLPPNNIFKTINNCH